LRKEIVELEKTPGQSSLDHLYLKNGKIQFGISDSIETNPLFASSSATPTMDLIMSTFKKCDNCGKADTSIGIIGNGFKDCSKCRKHLCDSCWPNSYILTVNKGFINDKVCLECQSK
jgi:hypothetical protein